ADSARGGTLQEGIAQATTRLQVGLREVSKVYSEARERVIALHKSGQLDEAKLATYAKTGRFDEATIALSLLADLPIGMIERAIAHQRTEQILVLAKAIGLSWDTTKEVLLLQAGARGSSTPEIDQCCMTFARLRTETAQKAIQFYRLRERAAKT